MRIQTWLLVSVNRCRRIIGKTAERCVSKMQMFRSGRKESAWIIEGDERTSKKKEEKEKMGVRRRAKRIREDWKGKTMEHSTGRKEDEKPRGEETRGAEKKMEGGGATRPSDDLMSSSSPGLK